MAIFKAPGRGHARSNLDAQSAAVLLARIDRALSTDRLFADAGLTLSRLAAAADATPHQVSEVLNRYANITFHELLNRRRVADVKAAGSRGSRRRICARAGWTISTRRNAHGATDGARLSQPAQPERRQPRGGTPPRVTATR